jgi:hypothetical protein
MWATACGAKVTVDSDGGLLGNGGSGNGGGSAGNAATCDETVGGTHICTTYMSISSAELSAEHTACTAAGGTVVSACSTTNALGTCAVSAGGITAALTYYAGNGLTAAVAQMACTASGGAWTGG